MATWTDTKGRLRESADEKHQLLSHIPADLLDPWISYDSWDAELAIRLITIGFNLDIEKYLDEAKDWPDGSVGLDKGHTYIAVYSRGMSIAKSSIAVGFLTNPDTPINWLKWAERKGYDISHLKQSDSPPRAGTNEAGGAPEPKEQRQDRRLKACIDAGLPMESKAALSRLPDGVGDVAASHGVKRQTFSTDVKAALKRRETIKREGSIVHRA